MEKINTRLKAEPGDELEGFLVSSAINDVNTRVSLRVENFLHRRASHRGSGKTNAFKAAQNPNDTTRRWWKCLAFEEIARDRRSRLCWWLGKRKQPNVTKFKTWQLRHGRHRNDAPTKCENLPLLEQPSVAEGSLRTTKANSVQNQALELTNNTKNKWTKHTPEECL